MHVVDKPLGKGENLGMLIRSGGKQIYDSDDGMLAGAWLLDEGTGLFVRDHGQTESHGLITGADWNTDGLTFIGTNFDRVAIGANNFNYTDNFTIVAWINTTQSTSVYNVIFGKWHTSYQNYFIATYAGKLIFYDYNTMYDVGLVDVSDGVDHLIVASINGEESRLFVDGIIDGVKFFPSISYANNGSGFIGGYGATGTSGNFTGDIDLVAIYNRVLTPTEIKAIYDIGLYRRTESYRIANA